MFLGPKSHKIFYTFLTYIVENFGFTRPYFTTTNSIRLLAKAFKPLRLGLQYFNLIRQIIYVRTRLRAYPYSKKITCIHINERKMSYAVIGQLVTADTTNMLNSCLLLQQSFFLASKYERSSVYDMCTRCARLRIIKTQYLVQFAF